jgi:hypothetical protein
MPQASVTANLTEYGHLDQPDALQELNHNKGAKRFIQNPIDL